MVALLGFDGFVNSSEVLPPLVGGQVLVSVALPARTTVGGIDIAIDRIDANAAPTLTLDVGDAANPSRFVSASTFAGVGGLLEYRPLSAEYYRYNLASSVTVTVNAIPATAVPGVIAVTVYGYPSLDIADSARMVLQALGVLAEGETPRAADHVLAVEALSETHEQFRFKSLANRQDMAWPDTLIPVFAGRAYARMAANLLADTFGLSAQRAAVLAQRATEAEREMRRQTQTKSVGQPVSLEPYKAPPPYILDFGVLG